jgi:hypothetical protein
MSHSAYLRRYLTLRIDSCFNGGIMICPIFLEFEIALPVFRFTLTVFDILLFAEIPLSIPPFSMEKYF